MAALRGAELRFGKLIGRLSCVADGLLYNAESPLPAEPARPDRRVPRAITSHKGFLLACLYTRTCSLPARISRAHRLMLLPMASPNSSPTMAARSKSVNIGGCGISPIG